MIPWIDKKIEKKFLQYFDKKREKILLRTMNSYLQKNPLSPKLQQAFEKQLRDEADRIYAIVNASILKARIKSAKYIFWISVAAGIIVSGVLLAASGGAVLPLIALALAGLTTYMLTLATIPIGYHQRVYGGMDSAISVFEKKLISSLKASPQPKVDKYMLLGVHKDLINLTNQLNSDINAQLTFNQKNENQLNELTQQLKNLTSRLERIESYISNPEIQINNSIHSNFNVFWNKPPNQTLSSKVMAPNTVGRAINNH